MLYYMLSNWMGLLADRYSEDCVCDSLYYMSSNEGTSADG
jgi:hypothetical protein